MNTTLFRCVSVVVMLGLAGCDGNQPSPAIDADTETADVTEVLDIQDEDPADLSEDSVAATDTVMTDTATVVPDTTVTTDTSPVGPTCTASTCLNRGTCTPAGTCLCPDRWGGERCEIPVPSGQRYIPPGQFLMGSPSSEPHRQSDEQQHLVTLTRGFLLGTTEVTLNEWTRIAGTGITVSGCDASCPALGLNYLSALAYLNERSANTGLQQCYEFINCGSNGRGQYSDWKIGELDTCEVRFVGLDCDGFRLPTEAEWEYAARAGTTTATYAGNLTSGGCEDTTLRPIAWFCGSSSSGRAQPVGQKLPNAWGLYDMLGNVAEWVADRHRSDYGIVPGAGAPVDPLITAASTGTGVLRGGSTAGQARMVRAAARDATAQAQSSSSYGLRLARTYNPACEGTGYIGRNCDIPVCRPACPNGESCIGPNQCTCTPDCTGKSCGSDGCGGSCGTCDDGVSCTTDSCNSSGQCVATPNVSTCNDNNPCTLDACGSTGCTNAPVCTGPQSLCTPNGNSYSCACPNADDIGSNCLRPCANGQHLDGDAYEPNECAEQATRIRPSIAGAFYDTLSLDIGPQSNDIDYFRLESPLTSGRAYWVVLESPVNMCNGIPLSTEFGYGDWKYGAILRGSDVNRIWSCQRQSSQAANPRYRLAAIAFDTSGADQSGSPTSPTAVTGRSVQGIISAPTDQDCVRFTADLPIELTHQGPVIDVFLDVTDANTGGFLMTDGVTCIGRPNPGRCATINGTGRATVTMCLSETVTFGSDSGPYYFSW